VVSSYCTKGHSASEIGFGAVMVTGMTKVKPALVIFIAGVVVRGERRGSIFLSRANQTETFKFETGARFHGLNLLLMMALLAPCLKCRSPWPHLSSADRPGSVSQVHLSRGD
jgi:hypothetical protein